MSVFWDMLTAVSHVSLTGLSDDDCGTGKTSLVKALSTQLSTAALDKSKQSRQRGMTLDLGFSCFFMDVPGHLRADYPEKKKLQITLVDCPGHASLIRTIIGGAQIIDMVLLVVDGVKGWQAQTTECLVLAELTSPHLVVALNKCDMFNSNEREEGISKASNRVRKRLQPTRFADVPIIGVAACVGGEKVAATGGEGVSALHSSGPNESFGIDKLNDLLKSQLPKPRRMENGSVEPFYFSIDHCFPIKGRGTVLTGTVLSGSVSVNDSIEFPTLALERKVKSMQMFKNQVQAIQQGDRAGICVSNLDAKLLERGIAATPGAIPLWRGALAVVRKVKYYTAGSIQSGTKFHVSVGHTTVMATVTFWGAFELQDQQSGGETNSEKVVSSSLGSDVDMAGLPRLQFDYNQDFRQQDGLVDSLTQGSNLEAGEAPLLHWALLDFQTPFRCPVHSLIIGSRLDQAVDNATGSAATCRLAFSGRLIEQVEPNEALKKVRVFTRKEKVGTVSRLGDAHIRSDDGKHVRYEVFGSELFKKETNMKPFIGMKMETKGGEVGEIKSSYGTAGKFRILFPAGTEAKEGDEIFLRFKRYTNDPDKAMVQDTELPEARPGARIEPESSKNKKKEKGVSRYGEVVSLKGDVLAENGKHTFAIISGFFTAEVNIKEKAGTPVVIAETQEEGIVVGGFGKAGKCKVSFPEGVSASVGAKAELKV